MRYTTIIDITDYPTVRRSRNATLLYLHMALRAGWHDVDRDIVDASIRSLAADTGLTLSATRHALGTLLKAQLIARQGTVWLVRKWIPEQAITPRAKTARQQQQIEAAAQRRKEQEERDRQEAIERAQRLSLQSQGKTSFMLYYEDLLLKAKAGDPEAERLVKRHKETYEAHLQSFNQKAT